ncbi:MAG: BamA/TamA family outer membrane protein [Bryobacterales bacterium]|nr:BamA/TamA family outer membrane protein [Bryobacterales bacterium]
MSILLVPAVFGQTREAEIEAARSAKEKVLAPETVTKAEQVLRDIKDQKVLERLSTGFHGLRPKIGNMVTGAGFALGPEFYRADLLREHLEFRTSAGFSFGGSQKYEIEARFPKLASERLELEFVGSHRNYARLGYYGQGPDSLKIDRTNYRMEDTSFDAIVTTRVNGKIWLGASLGKFYSNPGPGNDRRYISTERKFTAAQAPGIDIATNYIRPSIFAQLDYRNDPLGPKAGGNYVMQYSWNDDRKLNQYDFRRLDIDLQQYIPFFNRTRIIALRAKTILTDTDRNESIPFYLQPVLGGSDDLRGFRPFRFTDRNMVVYNAEYRFEVFAGLDGAVFADAGKVFPRRGMLNFRDLEGSVGFGLRFNVKNATFLRIDTGFSHEGFQVWFKFNDVFNQRRFGTSTGQPVY